MDELDNASLLDGEESKMEGREGDWCLPLSSLTLKVGESAAERMGEE